jgi:small multidrug resistance pump
MKMHGWLPLILAIVLEVAGTICMKLSMGFSRLAPSILTFVFYGLAFTALTFSLKKIDISIAYTVWSGIGTSLIVIIGFIYFKEQITSLKLASIALIILGVIGLNLSNLKH